METFYPWWYPDWRFVDGKWEHIPGNFIPAPPAKHIAIETGVERQDAVKAFLDSADELAQMEMWRQLVIQHPNWSRQLSELDREMVRLKKKQEAK